MSARDVIAAFLRDRDENLTPDDCDDDERGTSAAYIIEALTEAGHRIVAPGEVDAFIAALDRLERAAMAYERLGRLTKDDEKTREMRKTIIAGLASARSAALRTLTHTGEGESGSS